MPNSALSSTPSPEQIRETTRAVLERPEFAEPPPWNLMLLDIMNGIKNWLDRLAGWSEANPALARAVFILATLLLLVCLAHLLYLTFADALPFRRRVQGSRAAAVRWEILEGAATDWAAALQLAHAKIAEGDLKRAVWIAHRVLLALLDQQKAVQFAGWKTNSHYLREIAAAHPWEKIFRRLTDLYDRAVYADRPISVEDVRASIAQIDGLCAEAGPRP